MKVCQEIENKLPLYLDDSLSGADKKVVEEHLKSCPGCTKNLAQLKKMHALTNNLAEVEPPAGFKQKIMAGVREEAEKKSWFRKLFYPLKRKIPVQVFATVCIAVVAVYIYRAGEDQMTEVAKSYVPSPVIEFQKEQLSERKLKTSTDEKVQKEQSIKRQERVLPAKGMVREKDFAAMPSPPARDLNEQAAGTPAARSVMIAEKADKVESVTAANSAMTSEATDRYERAPIAKSAVMQDAQLEKKKDTGVGAVAMKAARAPQTQSMVNSFAVSLQVADRDKAVAEVEKILKKYEAKDIIQQKTANKTILTARLKNQKIDAVKDHLKTIGQFEFKDISTNSFENETAIFIEILND
jgi:glutaredoxin-related protein